jgi:hypothetical protein
MEDMGYVLKMLQDKMEKIKKDLDSVNSKRAAWEQGMDTEELLGMLSHIKNEEITEIPSFLRKWALSDGTIPRWAYLLLVMGPFNYYSELVSEHKPKDRSPEGLIATMERDIQALELTMGLIRHHVC